ncbi:Benzoate--CoA ligase [bacterium HR40]|nr:Benzoate--CoA ligase [bacterium HR40]
MAETAHLDTFVRDHLPPEAEWPELIFTIPDVQYAERVNCGAELLDRMVEAGFGDRPCLRSPSLAWSYAETLERVNRIARVLVDEMGVVPGNRVLLRAPNSPMLAACWLAVMKAGAVAVTTMPLLRAVELEKIVRKAAIRHALCDARLAEELERCRQAVPTLDRILYFGGDALDGLEARMRRQSDDFEACPTLAEDPALIAFTSGTTGVPKGCVHFHRDVLAMCDTFSRHIVKPLPDDLFSGSPPLGFTFGLGGLLCFPLRVGASTLLLEQAPPHVLPEAIETFRVTCLFTAPTAYRLMLSQLSSRNVSSLRRCVSAGETLPKATFEAFREATGIRLIDGIGATEMIHIFISAADDDIRPGTTGRPVPGYVATVFDEEFNECPPGVPGRLAVKGPTGCRYLADERQRQYVQRGWNITGDTYVRDADGYFAYVARSDDMIVSAGYNIAGPEVEAALLTHPAVLECGVVGAPDPERGQIVKAYVVLRPGYEAGPALVAELQHHVKTTIAPYKYPRAIEFVHELPKTLTGKLQRYRLRESAARQPA